MTFNRSFTGITLCFCLVFFAPGPKARAQGRAALVAQMVTAGSSSEKEKALAIAGWICDHIRYDVKRYLRHDTRRYSSKKVMRRKKALCDEYSRLFKDMCESVGIKTMVVDGFTKDLFFDVNDPFYRVDHAWNAVYLDGNWYLADLTFGSGHLSLKPRILTNAIRHWLHLPPKPHKRVFVQKRNEDYLLNNPEKFLFNHLPADPVWTLAPAPGVHAFESDSSYFHLRDAPPIANLHDEQGVRCGECLSKYSMTVYEKKLDMGQVTFSNNARQEEYLVTAQAARGDSMYRFIQNDFEHRIYADHSLDSLEQAYRHYTDAAITLRSHAKNLRKEYQYKMNREKNKLNGCKKRNSTINARYLRSRSTLMGWKKYTHDQAAAIRKKAASRQEVQLPETVKPGPLPDSAQWQLALGRQQQALEALQETNRLQIEQINRLNNCYGQALQNAASIISLTDSLVLLRLMYRDDLKKPVMACQVRQDAAIKKQLASLNDSTLFFSARYKKFLRRGDSLERALRVIWRSNYAMARQAGGLRPRQSDSLIRKISADIATMRQILAQNETDRIQALRFSGLASAMLLRAIRREKWSLNTETRVERLRAKTVLKDFSKEKSARAKTGKRVEASIYQRRQKVRHLQEHIRLQIKKDREKVIPGKTAAGS